MSRIDKALGIIKQAIEIEQFGYGFYNSLRSIVDDKDGQKVISYLANLEIDHVRWLEEEYTRQLDSIDQFDESTSEKISILGKEELFVVEGLTEMFEGTDPVQALEFAIDLEMKSIKFYEDYMELAEDDRIRILFRDLADYERDHINLLKENLDKLMKGEEWVPPKPNE
jgi:rubrerythrin